MALRAATLNDLGWIMSLCELDRIQKNSLHPIDYRNPSEYCDSRRPAIERLLTDPGSICLVREHSGTPQAYLLASLVNAPPVYAPGGPVCLVEEFEVVRPQDLETAGAQLLDECRRLALSRGAVLQRVIGAAGDTLRESFLLRQSFNIASEWYYGPTAAVRQVERPAGRIRSAAQADIPIIFSLGEEKRKEYEGYQPVFWRRADITIEAAAPWLVSQIEAETNIALVHETRRSIDGFLIANRQGYIDDYTVSRPGAWPTVGASLLAEASRIAAEKEIEHFLIVTAHLDQPKRAMVADLGLELIANWYVRSF